MLDGSYVVDIAHRVAGLGAVFFKAELSSVERQRVGVIRRFVDQHFPQRGEKGVEVLICLHTDIVQALIPVLQCELIGTVISYLSHLGIVGEMGCVLRRAVLCDRFASASERQEQNQTGCGTSKYSNHNEDMLYHHAKTDVGGSGSASRSRGRSSIGFTARGDEQVRLRNSAQRQPKTAQKLGPLLKWASWQ